MVIDSDVVVSDRDLGLVSPEYFTSYEEEDLTFDYEDLCAHQCFPPQ